MISVYFRGKGWEIDYQVDDVSCAFARWFPRNHLLQEAAIKLMFAHLAAGDTISGVPLLKELANQGRDVPSNDFGPIIVRLAILVHPELEAVAVTKPTGWGKARNKHDDQPSLF
jgi:hypothetical protein